MAKRQSKKLITEEITMAEAEAIFAEYSQADAKISKINAEMDVQFTKIREKNQDKLAELASERDKAFEKLQHFATSNPDFFASKRSIDMTHGKIGFRTGQFKAVCLFKKWDLALDKIKEIYPRFIRTKEEIDKQAIIDNRDDEEISKLYPLMGVRVDQDEAFYVEPKKEEIAA